MTPKKFPMSDEFQAKFRRTARLYFAEVEKAKAKERKAEAARQVHSRDCWQVDLATALERRAWDRVGRCEVRITRLIESTTGGKPLPDVEVFNWPQERSASFPAVECEGMVFALIGPERNFVVRPSWLAVRLDG